MIKLNRMTEYGLIALRHMSRKAAVQLNSPAGVTSAREVADYYGLPFEITAKTLQKLKDTGLIHSEHGAKGGYTLNQPLREISLAEFIQKMEGAPSIVSCASDSLALNPVNSCEYGGRCEIKGFMHQLNHRLLAFLSDISLADLTEEKEFSKELSKDLSKELSKEHPKENLL